MNVLGFVFTGLGLWYVFSPESVFKFKIKQGKLFGMKISGGKKAYVTIRVTGIFLLFLGLLMIFVK